MNWHPLQILLVSVRDLRLVFACASACLMYACGPSVGATTNFHADLSPDVTVSGASGLSCPAASGPLMLKVSTVRTSGISPFLVFFDATGTTDSSITGNATAFQNVTYTWNFGDSGTGTGSTISHVYATAGTYTVTVTATDVNGGKGSVTTLAPAPWPTVMGRHPSSIAG